MLNGMNKENGGTLIVPGSHLFGRHPDKSIDKNIETISAEGPPGCAIITDCLLYTSPSPRDATLSRMPSSA